MASQIETIFDNIAALTPAYGNTTPKVWNIDDIHEDASLVVPRRILMVTESPADPFEFVALGKRASITWRITDRLYVAPANETGGMPRWHGAMLRYIASYTTAALNSRSVGAASNPAHIVSLTSEAGTYDWPVGSGQFYYGVNIELEVQEII